MKGKEKNENKCRIKKEYEDKETHWTHFNCIPILFNSHVF